MKKLADARAEAADNLGLDLSGSLGGNLSQPDFSRLQAEMSRVIQNDSQSYSPKTVQWAKNVASSPGYSPPFTLAEKAGIFADEFAAQAQDLNPLSPQNRGTVATRLSQIAALAAVVFFLVLALRTAPPRQ